MKHHRILLATLGAMLLSAATLAAFETAADDEADASDLMKQFESLDWFEGTWRGPVENRTFESHYSSPEGGMMLSASKEFSGERLVMFEFERFEVREDGIFLTPYPFGKPSVSFRLEDYDRSVRRAVFKNPGHDFPAELAYERTGEDELRVRLTGEQNEKKMVLDFELKRVGD